MKRVTVSWHPERDAFTAIGTHAEHEITINAPHEGAPAGFSASELLLASVASCSAWDVVEILRKQRQDVRHVDVEVSGEQATEQPWPFVRISLVYRVVGRSVGSDAVERAVALSAERYCSAIATVRGVASIETRVEVVETGDAADREPEDTRPAAARR